MFSSLKGLYTPRQTHDTHWCIWRWQLLQGQVCEASEEAALHLLQDEHCLPLLAGPRRAPHPVHILVTICCHADLQPGPNQRVKVEEQLSRPGLPWQSRY